MVGSVSAPVSTPEPLYRHETEGRVTIQGEGLIQALIQSQPCDNLCITKLVCDWLKVFGTVLQGGL